MREGYKKCEILIFCMVFVAGAAFCQPKTLQSPAGRPFSGFFSRLQGVPPAGPVGFRQPVTGQAWVGSLGFFCRQEIRFNRQLPVQLRFRLGSVEQCDFLEGKRAIPVR